VPHATDIDLAAKEVVELASPDAITAFLAKLGYDTADRALLSPAVVGLSGESARRYQTHRDTIRRPGAVSLGALSDHQRLIRHLGVTPLIYQYGDKVIPPRERQAREVPRGTPDPHC